MAEMKKSHVQATASLTKQLLEMTDLLQFTIAKMAEMEQQQRSADVERKRLKERLQNAEVKVEALERQREQKVSQIKVLIRTKEEQTKGIYNCL